MSYSVSLRRHDTSTPWGFRMNGGSEFKQPLYIQKVNHRSLAERSGLQPGDAILQIGTTPTEAMAHDRGKMEIIRAGNDLDLVLQRNVVPVSPPPGYMCDQVDNQNSDLVKEHSPWKGAHAQNPDVQSRSFKVIQQQLSSEAQ